MFYLLQLLVYRLHLTLGLLQGWLDIGAIGHFIAVVLHLGWTNTAELLFVNLYFYIFIHQRFRADSWSIPQLHKAPNVVVNFFFATEQILICNLFVSIGIKVGQTFPEFFLFQKSKKKSAYNMGFGAIRADGSRVSTFVTLLGFGSGWTNFVEL